MSPTKYFWSSGWRGVLLLRKGDAAARRAQGMDYNKGVLLLILVMACGGEMRLLSAPQGTAEQNSARSLADSSWDGAMGDAAKGNSPAQLKFAMRKGSLMALLTYAGYEETLAVTVKGPSTIQMQGVSYRDLQNEHRRFNLDTMNGEVSLYGKHLSGMSSDSQGGRSRFEFRRIR
jgi:hypothetical protein